VLKVRPVCPIGPERRTLCRKGSETAEKGQGEKPGFRKMGSGNGINFPNTVHVLWELLLGADGMQRCLQVAKDYGSLRMMGIYTQLERFSRDGRYPREEAGRMAPQTNLTWGQ
jgi:hypothetical protein